MPSTSSTYQVASVAVAFPVWSGDGYTMSDAASPVV